jgi:hypothetical protein
MRLNHENLRRCTDLSHALRPDFVLRLGSAGQCPKMKIEGDEVKTANKFAFSLGLH